MSDPEQSVLGGPPKVREASIEDCIVADCPRCLEPMLLGEVWRDLILDDGCDVPPCPDCTTEGGDQWSDDADPMMDGVEYWAIAGDVLLVDGEEPTDGSEGGESP